MYCSIRPDFLNGRWLYFRFLSLPVRCSCCRQTPTQTSHFIVLISDKLQHWFTEHGKGFCGTDTSWESVGVHIVCCMDAEVTTPYLRRPAVGHTLSRLTCIFVFLHSPSPNSFSYVITCDNYPVCYFTAWCRSGCTAVTVISVQNAFVAMEPTQYWGTQTRLCSCLTKIHVSFGYRICLPHQETFKIGISSGRPSILTESRDESDLLK